MLDLNLGRVLDLCGDSALNLICRHESCKRPELHSFHELKRKPGAGYRTRSKRHVNQPWQAQSASALRASVLGAVSIVEPRSFAMILREVRDDYGGCLDRSVHRHLRALCESNKVVKLSWKHVHAYLLPGSKLIADPVLVYEQILAALKAP
jgi:hypothetical protein